MPDLTDDSSGDLTGKRNTLARVRGVLGTLDVRFMSCAGVNGVGLSTVDLIELVIADGKPPSGPTSEDDATWAIWIHVRSADALPSTNPLYLRGVRVYVDVFDFKPL